METTKKVIGQCSPEELRLLRLWDARRNAAEATARQMMRATTDALNDMQQKLVEEHREFQEAVEKAHGLRPDLCYQIDKKTGEITEHAHTHEKHPLIAAILRAHGGEDGTVEFVDPTKVN